MRILLTNDDNIQSEGLLRLADWARKLGEVVIVAPKVEQSAKSHGINIRTPFYAAKVDTLPGIESYAVDSTPADCVRYAVAGLEKNFDLVISGINKGFNMGQDILYSGTVSAAFEANTYGIKAIALSTDPRSWDPGISALDRVWAYFQEHRLLEKGNLFNVNIPLEQKGFCITRQGGPYFRDTFFPIENDLVMQKGHMVYKLQEDLTLDTDATMNGYISVSPLTVDRTDYQALKLLQK